MWGSTECCKQNLSCLNSTNFLPPVVPPAEDVDRYRRRFNMRMLVPGRPVKESPATPPPVPTDRPTYREKFIPPELSMWDYFVAKVRHGSWDRCFVMVLSWLLFLPQPFLPLSDSNALCDSDESGAEEDEDDDDAFLSDTQMTEHSDPNSYRYSSAAFVFFRQLVPIFHFLHAYLCFLPSWALIRLVMVKLAHHNIKNFLPLAGLDFTGTLRVKSTCKETR